MLKKVSLLLAGLLLLPGCYRVHRYKSSSLHSIDVARGYRKTRNGFTLCATRLTNFDKKGLFGVYSKKLARHGKGGPIEVIYLSLHNLTPMTYMLPYQGIDLDILSAREVARLFKPSTAGRIMGVMGSYLGVIVGYLGMGAGLVLLLEGNHKAGFIPLIGGVSATIAGAVYGDRYISSVSESVGANAQISDDLEDKTLSEGIVIQPGDKYEGLLFVQSVDYTPEFNVLVSERSGTKKKMIFEVDLHASFKNADRELLQQ
jgi:hypothetical protein